MITVLLLSLIYLAFISLGLPDSILGVAFPVFQAEWNLPLGAGGIINMVVIGGTIISSLTSGWILEKIGTGKVALISCLLTGTALLGFSISPTFLWLILLAVPLGLGGGAVDTALNNYVALHFKAHHMNWLHSFWGVGATAGPVIMGAALVLTDSWRMGYRTISLIQLFLAAILMVSLPLWKKHKSLSEQRQVPLNDSGEKGDPKDHQKEPQKGMAVFKIPGVMAALVTLILYCAIESAAGLWGSSFLIRERGLSAEAGAFWMAMYYGGITAGRFFSGFLSFKFNNTQLIRMGTVMTFMGVVSLFFPLPMVLVGAAFTLIGLGLSPIFPTMLHETPRRFGKENSQRIIGLQMGFGYFGHAFLSPLLGVIMQFSGLSYLPLFLGLFIAGVLAGSERLNHIVKAFG